MNDNRNAPKDIYGHMDLLHQIVPEPFPLSITIGRIDAGWMDLTMRTGTKTLNYEVSYIVDPISDFVAMAKKLIIGPPYFDFPLRNHYAGIVTHDCEGLTYRWVFFGFRGKILILCYLFCYEELDFLTTYDFSTDNISEFDYDEIMDMNEKLEFAVEGDIADFVKLALDLFDDASKVCGAEYIGHWPVDANKADLAFLRRYLYRTKNT